MSAGFRTCLFMLALGASPLAVADEYDAMLRYLTDTRIDGRALAGASGAIAVNQAAGDLNLQANLRGLAVGRQASAHVDARQLQQGQVHDLPSEASAVVGGSALSGGAGLASINQASGSGNSQVNALSAAVGQPGMHGGAGLKVRGNHVPAQRQDVFAPSGRRTLTRQAVVEAGALRGFEGVVQLNQIAGSANQVGNGLALTVQP